MTKMSWVSQVKTENWKGYNTYEYDYAANAKAYSPVDLGT